MHPPHAILSCIHHMHEPSCAMQNPPTPPCFTHHRHAIDQQIHLHGMHPSSINNRPSISPSPPQSNTPQQPTHRPGLHRTRTPCRRSCHQPHSPAHLQSTYPPSINHTKRHIQTTRPPINDATPHTITPDPLRPCPAPLKDATSTPQTPIGANDIWPLRDQSDENLGRVFSVWEVWG